MKLELALNDFFEQIYDITYNGKSISNKAFRCASIDDKNYSVEDIGCSDPFPKFADHIKMNVVPIIEEGLKKSEYTVHGIDAQQGEIHSHLVLRRKDFAILNDHDCIALQKILQSTIDKNNKAYHKRTNVPHRLFASNEHRNAYSQVQAAEPEHHYNLRHKK